MYICPNYYPILCLTEKKISCVETKIFVSVNIEAKKKKRKIDHSQAVCCPSSATIFSESVFISIEMKGKTENFVIVVVSLVDEIL